MWDSESAQDLVMKKLPGIIGSWILGSFGLYLLVEVVEYYDGIIDLAWSYWQRSDEIHTPHAPAIEHTVISPTWPLTCEV